ncbi:MAG: hypothetical protein HUU55_21290 [Myxococcales bacterium]|nr:hypothetical protein [Myxococcales bacterium]
MTHVLEVRYFTRGRVIVLGNTTTQAEAKKADSIHFYKPNIPLAVVEAKDNNHTVVLACSSMGRVLLKFCVTFGTRCGSIQGGRRKPAKLRWRIRLWRPQATI